MTYKLLDDNKHIEFSKYVKKKFLSDCSYKVYGILLQKIVKYYLIIYILFLCLKYF